MSEKKIEAVYGLTAMQSGMLYNSLINTDAGTDHVQNRTIIRGQIDEDILAESINMVIQRYSVLRTVFMYQNLDEAKQVVLAQRPVEIGVTNLEAESEEACEAKITDYLNADRQNRMDLSRNMLFRVHVFKCPGEIVNIIYTFHHIILDGWSVGIVMSEIYKVYDALLTGKEVSLPEPVNMGRYIKWLEMNKSKGESLFYWKKLLKGYEEPVEIPKTYNGKQNTGYRRNAVEYACSEELTQRMNEYCRKNQCTLSSLVHAIFGILLQRMTGKRDVVFGTVVSGRPAELDNVDSIVGMLINTIPFRVTSKDNQKFTELLKEVMAEMVASEKHSYLQLAEVMNTNPLKNDLLHMVIAFENYYSSGLDNSDKPYRIEKSVAYEQTSYDINTVFIPGECLRIKATFNEAVFGVQFIEEICTHFETIAEAVTGDEQICTDDIEFVSNKEKEKVIYKFNETEHEYSDSLLLHEMFEKNASQNPDAVAVICDDRQVTYKELNERTNSLARAIRDAGSSPEEPIGILVKRDIEMVMAVVAASKANCMYIPFESTHPNSRIVKEIDDLHISKIITTEDQKEKLEGIKAETGFIKDVFTVENYSDGTVDNPDNNINSDAHAYVIFTSGSTGKPKGVVVSHKPVVNVIEYLNRQYDIGKNDRMLFVTSLCFDLSVYDIWGMLAAGGIIEIVPADKMGDHHYLMKRLCSGDITVWDSAPSVIQQLMPLFDEYSEGSRSRLKRILTGGDWVDLNLSKEIKKISPNCKVTALGGATEATIYSNYYDIGEVHPGWVSIPYGKPIQNAKYYVLDEKRRPLPIGIKGDLYIGGQCLADGYINDETLTEEKFVKDPFVKGNSIMYKTGDSARWYYDGNLEFMGRNDFQVKLRGYRIETGEIEYQLKQYNGINDALVLVRGTTENDKALIAYFVTEEEITPEELTAYLRGQLPEYMIPKMYVSLLEFPLNDNGKIDRKNLPLPQRMMEHAGEIVPPANERQSKIRDVWAKVLGMESEEIGIDDIFSEIGGHSLLVIRLEVELKKAGILDGSVTDFISMGSRCTIRSIDENF